MLEGFYTAASGILTQQRTIDVLTNNMVNANTPGFQASRVVSTTFEQELLTRMENGNTGVIGKGAPIRLVNEVPVKFENSSLEETGRPFDLAINGDGYFNIQTQDAQGNNEQLLTRNGNFDLDELGYLVLRGHGQVLGENGPIQPSSSSFEVRDNGEVYDEDGKLIDRLLITTPGPEATLEQTENGMFRISDINANQPMDNPQVVQGWTERSNVDLNREYTLVMEAQRAFQACSSALQIIDQINQKAASQIAAL